MFGSKEEKQNVVQVQFKSGLKCWIESLVNKQRNNGGVSVQFKIPYRGVSRVRQSTLTIHVQYGVNFVAVPELPFEALPALNSWAYLKKK